MTFSEKYGPWALVSGASEGTGRELARQIAARGLPCVLIARRQGPLREVADQIRTETGLECVIATADLSAADADQQVLAAVDDREIGLYVANAGADPHGARFLDLDLTAWERLVQRNVVTTMRMCHHLGRAMRDRGRGGILLVNSGACYGGGSHLAIYTATKAFELNFGESLWAELRPYGVDVLDLVLGMTDTPAFRELLTKKGINDVPPGTASPANVARVALDCLGEVPLHNWGLADDDAGYLPMSAAARQQRIALGAWWEGASL
ncbi:SDR family NAD(P)-dependent oxidoreductase [Jatrophihabitans sp. DSM 45814]